MTLYNFDVYDDFFLNRTISKHSNIRIFC